MTRVAPDLRLSDILSALSYALDITEGQRPGHAVRTCLIGMRLAEAIGLPGDERGPLFYALLLKDLGCSSNAARLCALSVRTTALSSAITNSANGPGRCPVWPMRCGTPCRKLRRWPECFGWLRWEPGSAAVAGR